MAQRKDENKRLAIRNAVVADVIDVGLAGTSMARIAARAKLSPGTIYLYYPNKEAMLQQVFLEIKRAVHQKLTSAFDPADNYPEKIRKMWFAMFDYLIEQPEDFAFQEIINAAQILTGRQQQELDTMAGEIRSIISDAVTEGVLKPAPVESILAVLMAPALHLARKTALAGKPIERDVVQESFAMIWAGITKIES